MRGDDQIHCPNRIPNMHTIWVRLCAGPNQRFGRLSARGSDATAEGTAIKANIAESLNIVLHVERRPGARFVSEVSEIVRYDTEADAYHLHCIYSQQHR